MSLGWGIVGCGDVVCKKSGPAILQAGGSRIVGVMRRQPAQARAFAEANGIGLCTDDAGAVIGAPGVDIVYVATPPSSHRAYVLQAAAAGRHVLVEKPMGLSADEDAEMIDACSRAGVELFVAYYRRFQPHVLKMRELVAAGAIGRPVLGRIEYAQPTMPTYSAGWRVQPAISGGGLFVDVVTHRLDLLVMLLGEPVEVAGLGAATAGDDGVEDVTALAVRFAGGALGNVCGDFATGRSEDRFLLAGTEGCIESVRLDGHAFALRRGREVQVFAFDPFPAPHLGLIRHIERVLAGAEANACSGRDARWTDWIVDLAGRGA